MTRLGIAQITGIPGAVEDNRARTAEAIADVARQRADVVVLPELIVPGYTLDTEILEAAAERVPGETASLWARLAARYGVTVIGGICERDGQKLFNSVVAMGPDGLLLHYRKLHLFGAERGVFHPGDLGLPVVDASFGRLAVCVCYDLRFPEVVRILALRGAELVAVPSAWVPGFDAVLDDRTHGCAQSDGAVVQANLNQLFVACASQAGQVNEKCFLGSSLVVDPFGRALLGPRSRTESWVGVCEIDLAAVRRAAQRGEGVRPRDDRRTDVYAVVYEDEAL